MFWSRHCREHQVVHPVDAGQLPGQPRRLRQVHRDTRGVAADLGRDLLRVTGVPAGKYHRLTPVGGQPGDLAADPGRAADDGKDLALTHRVTFCRYS